jgi:hypothetical protein
MTVMNPHMKKRLASKASAGPYLPPLGISTC